MEETHSPLTLLSLEQREKSKLNEIQFNRIEFIFQQHNSTWISRWFVNKTTMKYWKDGGWKEEFIQVKTLCKQEWKEKLKKNVLRNFSNFYFFFISEYSWKAKYSQMEGRNAHR